MEITALSQTLPNNSPVQAEGGDFSALGSTEFFKLIITDLLNQDPLNPTDNQKLLEQISLIRDIEMRNEMTTSMRSLIEQQRFGSATSLLGQFVEGNEAAGFANGVVAGVRFDTQGAAILMLDGGAEMPLSNLLTVTSLKHLADGLVGQMVTAEVIEDGKLLEVEGIVTGLRSDSGTLMVELDTGRVVPLASVKERRSAA
jgi:flagellar basal-body rod modification protein FlgD